MGAILLVTQSSMPSIPIRRRISAVPGHVTGLGIGRKLPIRARLLDAPASYR
jgi:hypothetical protein